MFHLDNETGVPVMPNLPPVQSNTTKWFTEGGNGVPPSWPGSTWFNIIQAEILNVLAAADITPDKENLSQLSEAITTLISSDSNNFLKVANNLSEIEAAGPAAVAAAWNHLGIGVLLTGALQKANNLSEIKTAGPAAVAATLLNLGLGDVAHLAQLTGIVGTSRNAKMSIPVTLATATFTADELVVQDAIGGLQYKLSGFSNVINLATTGVGGMDTGTVPVTGFVALYAIYNPTTQTSALLAVNATSAVAPEVCVGVMPAGYTASALVSVNPIAASKFKVSQLMGRNLSFQRVIALSTTTLGVATRLAIASSVPRNAIAIKGSAQVGGGTTSPGFASYQISGDASMCGNQEIRAGLPVTAGQDIVGSYGIDITEQQALYYIYGTTLSAPSPAVIYISGYSF
ncbi:hypothetical protein ACNSO8_23185 [Yersinia sp. LJYL362]|uniref:hypothetical protein n=1 Tax=Yersinia sp. LJYL362 TaxID=3402108 RepID=UPI003AB3C29B